MSTDTLVKRLRANYERFKGETALIDADIFLEAIAALSHPPEVALELAAQAANEWVKENKTISLHGDEANDLARVVIEAYRDALSTPLPAPDTMREAPYVPTLAEIQSGFDRVKWAESLIAQLPIDHDGRNSWLLNYGRSDAARVKQEAQFLKWDDRTMSTRTALSGAKP